MNLDACVIDLHQMEQEAEDRPIPHDALQLGLMAGADAANDADLGWVMR